MELWIETLNPVLAFRDVLKLPCLFSRYFDELKLFIIRYNNDDNDCQYISN